MSQKPDDQMTFDEVWAELHKARAELRGPDGFASWQDAAVNERVRRARAVDALRHAKKFIEELRVPPRTQNRLGLKSFVDPGRSRRSTTYFQPKTSQRLWT